MKTNLSLAKEKIKILLLENIHPQAKIILDQNGYHNVESIDSAISQGDLISKIKSVHMLGIRSRTLIDQRILDHADKLIAIGCFCIGTDQVQLDYATRQGIPVFNAPHSNTRSVAELVIGLAIMLMRGIFAKSAAAHQHKWIKSAKGSNELRGKTIGIIGYGHIGSQVSILAEALGMRVIYYDIRSKLPLGNATQVDNLNQLLKSSHIITLHVPEDDSTIEMINEKNISLMPEDACLINASRGRVVNINDLVTRLKRGTLRGAAIDVFPNEPGLETEEFKSPLIGIDNVILTPHIGGSTREAQQNIGNEVASKLVNFSDLGNTEGAVNFPNVNLRPNDNTTRFLHIHENRPGMLKSINEIIADRNINVSGQYLETKNDIGYVVLDIEPLGSRQESIRLRKALHDIPGSIRTRILY
jgi:D-3-phosphoglycerate dehydrogenase / 2-oxoglutarate reductase